MKTAILAAIIAAQTLCANVTTYIRPIVELSESYTAGGVTFRSNIRQNPRFDAPDFWNPQFFDSYWTLNYQTIDHVVVVNSATITEQPTTLVYGSYDSPDLSWSHSVSALVNIEADDPFQVYEVVILFHLTSTQPPYSIAHYVMVFGVDGAVIETPLLVDDLGELWNVEMSVIYAQPSVTGGGER